MPSALLEGVMRYLPRYLPAWVPGFADSGPSADPTAPPAAVYDEHATAQGTADLRAFLDLARAEVPRVLVVQFPERSELGADEPQPGYGLIKAAALESGAEVFSAFAEMQAALGRGDNPYRDNIHVNDLGQALLANVFFDAVMAHAPAGAEAVSLAP